MLVRLVPISSSGGMCRSADSVNAALRAAVTCAILAPAGSHRSRMLSLLYKDERVSAPGAVPQFPFLEKMLMERLVTPCAPPLGAWLLAGHSAQPAGTACKCCMSMRAYVVATFINNRCNATLAVQGAGWLVQAIQRSLAQHEPSGYLHREYLQAL